MLPRAREDQDQERRDASLYQRNQSQIKNKNQESIGASRAGGAEGVESDPPTIGESVVDAVRAAFAEGPGMAEGRMYRAIVAACPELAGSWAPGYVAKLVALGEIPVADVRHALEDFVAQCTRAKIGAAPPIRSRAGLASHLLKKALARNGHPWRKLRVG